MSTKPVVPITGGETRTPDVTRAPKQNFRKETIMMATIKAAVMPVFEREKVANGAVAKGVNVVATATAPNEITIKVTFGQQT